MNRTVICKPSRLSTQSSFQKPSNYYIKLINVASNFSSFSLYSIFIVLQIVFISSHSLGLPHCDISLCKFLLRLYDRHCRSSPAKDYSFSEDALAHVEVRTLANINIDMIDHKLNQLIGYTFRSLFSSLCGSLN